MIIRTFLFIAFFLPGIISAQTNFQSGFIIIDKDTITTLINRESEVVISKSITTKNKETVQSYLPSDIKSLVFTSDKIRFDAVDVNVKLPNATISEKRFAKLLLRGRVSLYKLYLEELRPKLHPENDYIYVLKKDNVFYTLVQYEDPTGKTYDLRKRYIGMLTALMDDCETFREANFQNQEFYDKDMIELVDKYNRCKAPDEKSTIANYTVKPITKRSVEISYSTIVPAEKQRIPASRGFSAGYLWDILKPDLSTRHSLITGFSYMNLQYDENNWALATRVTEHLLRFKVLDQFNIGKINQKIIPFANFGASVALSKTQGYRGVGTMVFLGAGGGLYLDKIRISTLFETWGLQLKETDKLLNVSIAYRINKIKAVH